MNVTVRFAPSPTGNIHVGNARAALINYLFYKQKGGRYILRFDDTDHERSSFLYAKNIIEDLRWLSVEPDEIIFQSARFSLYETAANKLRAQGRLYPCYETQEELEYKRRCQRAEGQPPVYDRQSLHLSNEEKMKFEAMGRRPHWRFLLSRSEISWHDLVRGKQTIDTCSLSDPVLIRENGSYLYTLPSVVDDMNLGVTHVVRGADHVTNTAIQIELFRFFGSNLPAFAHYSLFTTEGGESLSKRASSLSIARLREDGVEPMALFSLAVLTGSSDSFQPCSRISHLIDSFSFEKLSRSAVLFDKENLMLMNAKFLHHLDFKEVNPRLLALGFSVSEPLWLAVRGNLTKLSELRQWEQVVMGEIDPVVHEEAFLAQALSLLPDEPWDETTCKTWVKVLQTATNRKGKELFSPLRLALTGRENGPEMACLLPLIGRKKILLRLSGLRA
ncbi:MAG: glutamate--tRNA ligase [Alphaproteobacteria bacterium]|nr:glutamate--tRNA ligase [Alphaproteobacteria bacterium]